MSWTLGSAPIIRAHIVHTARCALSAELELAGEEVPSGQVELRLPGLTLACAVVDAGMDGGQLRVQVVGGRGGLAREVPGQHYQQPQVRTVLDNILAAAGEVLAADSDAEVLGQLLQHYQSPRGSAGAALDALCAAAGTRWTVTAAGEVRIGEPAWTQDEPEHVLQDQPHQRRALRVAFADRALQPGTTFHGQHVEAVEHMMEPGRWRSVVRYGGQDLDGLLAGLAAHMTPLVGQTVYEGEVAVQGDGTVDVSLDEKLGLGKGLQGVPVALIGPFTVKVAPGARALIEFVNGDPTRPIVRQYLEATFTEVVVDATTIKIGPTQATLVALGKALKPAAAHGDKTDNVVNGNPATITLVTNTVVKV